MKKYTLGIDVGGTNIKLGLVSSVGKVVSRTCLDTSSFKSNKNKFIQGIALAADELMEETKINRKDILGVGVGLPGLVDPVKGVVNFLPNISGWKNIPFKKLLQDELKIPTVIDNDVNLVTLGEWQFGAGKGYKNFVCITLGTGVGSGLVLNNDLYRGEGNVAGELGHIPINEKGPKCSCGGWGCFESYVGNQYLIEKGSKIFKNKNIQLEDVFNLANHDNVRAVQFWDEVATHTGNVLVGIINLLNPRLIIIGGGVSNSYKYLGATINKIVKQRAMKIPASMVKIVKAKLGDDAGLIGAHVLVKERSR